MSHKDWCGKPCVDCNNPCKLDESMPCSLDCKNLNPDGTHDLRKCNETECDVSRFVICSYCNQKPKEELCISCIHYGLIGNRPLKKIEVDTVFGKLYASVGYDPDYPGIYLGIEREDADGMSEKTLALAECTPNMPTEGKHSLRLLIWNSDDDDYTDDFTFIEGKTQRKSKESVWEDYRRYLNTWIETHNGAENYGMTPACFDEWYANECEHETEGVECF